MHEGRSLSSGHYTAMTVDAAGQWRFFNDDKEVEKVKEESDVLKPRPDRNPYFLFYTRI